MIWLARSFTNGLSCQTGRVQRATGSGQLVPGCGIRAAATGSRRIPSPAAWLPSAGSRHGSTGRGHLLGQVREPQPTHSPNRQIAVE